MTDQRHLALTFLSLQMSCAAFRMAALAAEQTRRQTDTLEELIAKMQAWRESDLECTRLIRAYGHLAD